MLHFSRCEKENLVILMMRVRQGSGITKIRKIKKILSTDCFFAVASPY